MRATLVCIIAIGLSASPNADQLAVREHGLSPCAKFGQYYKHDPESAGVFYAWALGFMSGMNMGRRLSIRIQTRPPFRVQS